MPFFFSQTMTSDDTDPFDDSKRPYIKGLFAFHTAVGFLLAILVLFLHEVSGRPFVLTVCTVVAFGAVAGLGVAFVWKRFRMGVNYQLTLAVNYMCVTAIVTAGVLATIYSQAPDTIWVYLKSLGILKGLGMTALTMFVPVTWLLFVSLFTLRVRVYEERLAQSSE